MICTLIAFAAFITGGSLGAVVMACVAAGAHADRREQNHGQ